MFERRRQALQGQAWSLVVPGIGHLSFSDVTAYSPLLARDEDVSATHRLVNAFTLAFFETHLEGQPADTDRLQWSFPQVRFQTAEGEPVRYVRYDPWASSER